MVEKTRWPRGSIAFFAIALVLFSTGGPLFAQSNPFFGSREHESADRSAPVEETPPSVGTRAPRLLRGRPPFPAINAFLRDQQRTLNERVGVLMRTVSSVAGPPSKGSTSSVGVITVIVAAFLYGLVHAALPGHRKVLLVSYFVAVRAPIRHAVLAGVSVAALHSGAAAILVLGGYYLLQTSLSLMLDRATVYMQAVTAVIIAITGVVILVMTLREAISSGRDGSAVHAHGPSTAANGRPSVGMLPAIVISAVVPCPGTAMILLFAVSLGALGLGIIATFAFSFGMAVTLVAVCVIAVVSKRAVTGALDGRAGEILHTTIEGVGAVAMCVFGVIAFMAVL